MSTELHELGGRLVGHWTTEATHPQVPVRSSRGGAGSEWLDGEEFLIFRFQLHHHPEFPDVISILGDTDGLRMHYFDARRAPVVRVDRDRQRVDRRDGPTLAGRLVRIRRRALRERMTYTLEHQDQTIAGKGQLSHDDVHWEDDLEITFRRTS